jgi:hypothetical protein
VIKGLSGTKTKARRGWALSRARHKEGVAWSELWFGSDAVTWKQGQDYASITDNKRGGKCSARIIIWLLGSGARNETTRLQSLYRIGIGKRYKTNNKDLHHVALGFDLQINKTEETEANRLNLEIKRGYI